MTGAAPRAAVLTLLVLGAGCPQRILGVDDGGVGGGLGGGGGGGAGGGLGGGGGGGAGGGLGGGGGGGTGGGVGGGTGGGAADAGWTWTSMNAPDKGMWYAVAGTGPDDLYFAGDYGRVWHYDGTLFDAGFRNPQSTNLYTELYVSPEGAVFVGGYGGEVATCMTGCASQGGYQPTTLSADVVGLCGRSAGQAAAVTFNSSNHVARLHLWDGGTWSAGVVLGTGPVFHRCFMLPTGRVLMAAASYVYYYEGGDAGLESMSYPPSWLPSDIALQEWQAVWSEGTQVFATGSGRRVARRLDDAGWELFFDPGGDDTNKALAGWPGEVYAGGKLAASPNVSVWTADTGWSYLEPAARRPDVSINALFAPAPDQLVVVGWTSATGFAPQVYRGTR